MRLTTRQEAAVSVLLLGLLLGTTFSAVYRQHLREIRRHVIVVVAKPNDLAEIYVNCEFVRGLEWAPHPGEPIDLGWLRPDDRISLSVTNNHGLDAAFGFTGISNDQTVFEPYRARTNASGFRAETGKVAFAQTYTASGTLLGNLGCVGRRNVSTSTVPGYAPLDDMQRAKPGGLKPVSNGFVLGEPFDDAIDGLVPHLLWALAIAGALSIWITPSTRSAGARLVHDKRLQRAAGAAVALLGLAFATVRPTPAFWEHVALGVCVALLLISTGALTQSAILDYVARVKSMTKS